MSVARVAAALVLACAALSAHAQTYPTKPIRVIVPHPPATPVDLAIRVFADRLRDVLGQPFVIENRYGASGGVGAEVVARAPADGYTLMATIDATMTVVPLLYSKFPVDVANDFVMTAMLGDRASQVLVIPATHKAQDLAAFFKQARATKERLIFAQAEPGTPGHLIGLTLARQTGVDADVVNYRGPVAAMQEVLAERASASFSPVSSVAPFVRAGKLRALAITGDARSEFLPEVPTFAQGGFPEVLTRFNWVALFARTGTPPEILTRLNAEIRTLGAQPAVKEQLARFALSPGTQNLEGLRELWAADRAYWAKTAPQLNIKLD